MNLMVFEGFLGAGKTLGASVFACYYQYLSSCTLYSNYGLKGSKLFSDINDFLRVCNEDSSIIVLDEAHIDLDSRSFSTNHVKQITQTSYFLRKMRSTLILTSPSFNDLDSRIRGITNILCRVSKDSRYFYYEMWDVQSRKYLRTMSIDINKAFTIASNIYNTNAIVTPIETFDTKKEFDSFLDKLKIESEKYYINKHARVTA